MTDQQRFDTIAALGNSHMQIAVSVSALSFLQKLYTTMGWAVRQADY